MPAVTADTLTLPRIDARPAGAHRARSRLSRPPPADSRARASRCAAPSPASMADLDPFVHMDQMGEVEYGVGRAQGHAVAPAPRLRDVHLPHRRAVHPPGLPRRWRRHRERRHAVHDRRRRASCTSRPRRRRSSCPAGCSTASSCGSTCRGRRSGIAPQYQAPGGPRRHPGLLRRRRCAGTRAGRHGRRPRGPGPQPVADRRSCT